VSQAERLVLEASEILDAADRENRPLTGAERVRVKGLIDRAHERHAVDQQLKEIGHDLGAGMPNGVFTGGGDNTGGGPGDMFIKSAEYLRIRDPGSRGQTWSTGPIDVGLAYKGTLLESGVGGPGGGAVPAYYEPGIVSKLFEPLGVSDVFGSSQTTASQVRYVVEGTAASGAAGVAEGAAKPESTLVMSEVTEAIRKIATVLPVSDELLEDAVSIQSYLNTRLSLFVKIEEERQLLRGAGSGSNELLGVFGRGINTTTKGAADDNAVALARVIANTRGSSFLAPDTVIMHPTNWLNTRLLRDGTGGTVGQFYGGGPFTGAYGNTAGAAGLFGESIWGVRVVLSTLVGSGTALVGNFGQGAHVWRRGGMSVEASNSHDTFFVKNLNMLRAEERLGLGVYRPAAFTAVSGMA
jgi:HK97 family phage major capsid protein